MKAYIQARRNSYVAAILPLVANGVVDDDLLEPTLWVVISDQKLGVLVLRRCWTKRLLNGIDCSWNNKRNSNNIYSLSRNQ
jgi:hypothetical protein